MKLKLCFVMLFVFQLCDAQTASVIKWSSMEQLLHKKSDTTYVINFWATWCKPCVEELPYFLEQEKMLSSKPVKFYFISLDFKRDVNTRLIPFLEKQNITSGVYLLDEPDYNSWIDKVDSTWGGAIPATLIYNHALNKRTFYEKEFTLIELEKTLKTHIQ